MVYINTIILSIIEGITEFLPVSSTGHLIIAETYISLTEDTAFNDAFMVIIQLPAILAVVIYFWDKLWPFNKPPEERNARLGMWTVIVVAFLPAAFLGVLVHSYLQLWFFNPVTVSIALIIGGLIIILIERTDRKVVEQDVFEVGYLKGFGIGCFQCLAMIPGTSRSAASIIGGMLLRTSRPAAAEFSFFLAIPTMLGACTVELYRSGFNFDSSQWTILALGSVVSFISGYFAVMFLMRLLKHYDFTPFGYYRIGIGTVVLVWHFFIR